VSMRIIYMFVLHRSNKALSEFSSSTTTLRCPCSFGDLAVLKYALRIQPAQFAWNKDITPLSYRTLTSPLHPSSSVSLRRGSRTATRAHVHSSRALCTELLQCCITLVLHDSSLLEVCDLSTKSAQVHCSPNNNPLQSNRIQRYHHFPRSSIPNRTYPATCACALKLPQLRRTSIPCLLVFPHAVDDAVAVQALEEAGGGGVGCAEEPPNQPMVDVLKGCDGMVCWWVFSGLCLAISERLDRLPVLGDSRIVSR
jgi:hypothetical protein